jgi:hypothetical protein
LAETSNIPTLVGRAVDVTANFYGAETGTAIDLSGIDSAAPHSSLLRRCLVIDNEGIFAQFAELGLDELTLKPGDKVRLLPEHRIDIVAVGAPPAYEGTEVDEYLLDGEGVTWLAPHYYITGSHSIHDWEDGDNKGSDYRRSAFLVARVGEKGGQPELSYRLNELLTSRKTFAPYFLKSPENKEGINIEGIAAYRRRLYFGFRSPVIDGEALILSVKAAALFEPDADLAAKTIRVPLGKGIGIRDLTALPDGRFLILAGPKPDGGAGFTIQLFDERRKSVQPLGKLMKDRDHKPEAMLVAAHDPHASGGASLRVLILSDGPENGRPHLYDIAIPPA